MRRLASTPFAFVLALATSLPAQASGQAPAPAPAQRGDRPALSETVRRYVAVDTPVVAFTHARVIDGTGAAPMADRTVLVRDGRVVAIGSTGSVAIPADAKVVDLTGKTLIPGLVMVHEHLYYPTGPGVYANLSESFTRLYLAGGVTSMRTAGNMNGYGELTIARDIEAGEKPGPWIDATAPYLEGPGLPLDQVHALTGPADARRMVDFWADAGATSLKAYMHITRAELAAALQAAHARGMKVTGHLCSITYREAAELGIDDLEHGFYVSTDFVPGKAPDECPGQREGMAALVRVQPGDSAFQSLIADLVRHHVAVTSTPTVFETFTPGRPRPPGLEVLDPILRQQFEQTYRRIAADTASVYSTLFPKVGALERAFVRAGGLLLVGTDPTGYGGVVPGFSNQRALELLVEEGFTPVEAIRIGTLNGALYLGRADRVGSIAPGKQADLVVIDGNPAADIADIRHVEMVFKQGVGYDPARLIDSVRGRVGLF